MFIILFRDPKTLACMYMQTYITYLKFILKKNKNRMLMKLGQKRTRIFWCGLLLKREKFLNRH